MKELVRKAQDVLEDVLPEIIHLRQDLHREPEVAWNEYKTIKKVENFLKLFNYKDFYHPVETGVFTDLLVNPDYPFVALRADLDALSMQDLIQAPYRSIRPGISHACGHDVHTAVICGVAAVLSRMTSSMPVNIRFIFQPAEEPIPSGAPKFIENDVLRNVRSVLGIHVEPELRLGTISLTKGWVNAQSVKVQWRITGKGGHSARPHLTLNPISIGAELVNKLQTMILAYQENIDLPVVFTITGFHSGELYNTIPQIAEIQGTLRIADLKHRDRVINEILKVNELIENNWKGQIDFQISPGAPPVINDSILVEKFKTNLLRNGFQSTQIEVNFRSMGGDDFGWYSQELPSVLARFGTATGSDTPKLHTNHFDVPQEIFRIAVNFFLIQLFNYDDNG